MAWQSSTINPASTSPAADISKITNDLSVLKGVFGGTPDAGVPNVMESQAGAQAQTATAFTTAGTSTAYTLTPSPAITALATYQRWRVNFHTAAGATPTLAVSGQTAKNIRYRDATGTKLAATSAQITTGFIADVEYDGTDYVLLTTADAVGAGTPNTFGKAQRGAYVTLTDGATITPDFSAANMFRVQLGGNRTLANPTNLVAGQSGSIDVYQDNTGSRTLAYQWGWQWPSASAPTLSSTARAKDKLLYQVDVYAQSTITVTIATPGVVTWTAHGLMAGQQVQLTTTGALPTGLVANTTYFVIPVDANSFQLAATQSGTAITTSGSQSGTHTMTAISITGQLMGALA